MHTLNNEPVYLSLAKSTVGTVRYVASWLASFLKLLTYNISKHALPYTEYYLHPYNHIQAAAYSKRAR